MTYYKKMQVFNRFNIMRLDTTIGLQRRGSFSIQLLAFRNVLMQLNFNVC